MSNIKVNTINDASGGSAAVLYGVASPPNSMGLQARFNEVLEYRDGRLFWKKTLSNVAVAGKEAGCASTNSYGSVTVDKQAYCPHRIVFCMHHGYMPDQVDHIDGNRKNHKIENLRAANNMTNNMNKGAQSNSKTGVKNICWSKQNKKWWVQVSAYGKKVVSKMFDDFELAELVAAEARDKFHGKFARG
jgi:hypothetical protein